MVAGLRRHGESMALLGILAVAAVIRLLWVSWFPMAPESDFATFLDMATKIANGSWRPEEYGWVYQGSGYPTLMAPLIALGGGLDALRLANVAAQLATVGGVWLLARRLFGPRGGLLAAVLAAVMPGLWSFAPVLAAESVATALLVAVALSLRSLQRAGPVWRPGLTGLAVAALACTRPSFLPFVLLVAVAVLVAAGSGRWRHLLWYAAGVALVAAPVMALNTTNGGPALPIGAAGWQTWLVNNEHATGAWFDASADDANPFNGLTEGPEARTAQTLLGRQFIVANPAAALDGLLDRYRVNWRSDTVGIDWTLDRAPDAWRDRVPLAGQLDDAAQALYLLVLALAAVAAIRHRTRAALLIPVVLPLGYAMLILAVAEANARYHSMFLPLFCVMAGGALVPTTRRAVSVARSRPAIPSWATRWVGRGQTDRLPVLVPLLVLGPWLVIGLGRAVWDRGQLTLPHWLVAVVVLAPVLGCGLAAIRARCSAFVARAAWPGWRGLGVGLAAAAVVLLPVWGGAQASNRLLADLAAVAPAGWERRVDPDSGTGPDAGLPLLLEDSGTATGLREVSFPDAALLQFDAPPRPGDVVRLDRTLTDLHVGERYVFYLQAYDPGRDGDPTEGLAVTLNGTTVWDRATTGTEPGTWRYIRVDWVADAPRLDLAVVRVAGQHYQDDLDAVPRVRTLHLYPRY